MCGRDSGERAEANGWKKGGKEEEKDDGNSDGEGGWCVFGLNGGEGDGVDVNGERAE